MLNAKKKTESGSFTLCKKKKKHKIVCIYLNFYLHVSNSYNDELVN